MWKNEKVLSRYIIVIAGFNGVLALVDLGTIPSDVHQFLTLLLVASACILGVLHGSRSSEKQSILLGCAALLLSLLASPGWGNGGEFVASVPLIGALLVAVFHNGIMAVVGIATLSLLSRILVFSPRERASGN